MAKKDMYQEPTLEIYSLSVQDVITMSTPTATGGEYSTGNDYADWY